MVRRQRKNEESAALARQMRATNAADARIRADLLREAIPLLEASLSSDESPRPGAEERAVAERSEPAEESG